MQQKISHKLLLLFSMTLLAGFTSGTNKAWGSTEQDSAISLVPKEETPLSPVAQEQSQEPLPQPQEETPPPPVAQEQSQEPLPHPQEETPPPPVAQEQSQELLPQPQEETPPPPVAQEQSQELLPQPQEETPPPPVAQEQSPELLPQPQEETPPSPVAQEQEPLPKLIVKSRPKIPLPPEEGPPPASDHPDLANKMMDYGTIAKGRAPLAILNAGQDPQSYKWYLFSSAKRGIENSSDVIDIVSISTHAESSKKGDEVKAQLIQLGLKPEQLRVAYTTGSDDQAGKIYIFGK